MGTGAGPWGRGPAPGNERAGRPAAAEGWPVRAAPRRCHMPKASSMARTVFAVLSTALAIMRKLVSDAA